MVFYNGTISSDSKGSEIFYFIPKLRFTRGLDSAQNWRERERESRGTSCNSNRLMEVRATWAGIRSRKRDWSAPPSSAVFARETICKKEHSLAKNEKFPPLPHARSHIRSCRQTIRKRSLLFFPPFPLRLIKPIRSFLYAWNEIFLKLFSADLRSQVQGKPLNDGDTKQHREINSAPSIARIDK